MKITENTIEEFAIELLERLDAYESDGISAAEQLQSGFLNN